MKTPKQNNNEELSIKGNNNAANQTINNFGLTVSDACTIAEHLFEQNFPRLQQLAADKVKERVDDFLSSFKEEIIKNGGDCLNFEAPDFQYALYDSMKAYAKYGTDYLLRTLTKIMTMRNNYSGDLRIKVAIDDAITIAPKLDQSSLNFLSLVFYAKHVRFNTINDLDSLMLLYKQKVALLPFNNINHGYLNSIGCYSIRIGSFSHTISKNYNITEQEVKDKMPKELLVVPGDYGLTYPAIVLAIQNIKLVIGEDFDLKIWLN